MKKIKIISAIYLTALLAAAVMSASSFAADPDKYTIFVDSDKDAANPGERANISVILEPGAHVSAITVDLLYDAECFEYQNDAAAGMALGGGMSEINAKEEGKIIFSFITLGSLFNESDQTILMTASFKILKPNGTFTVLPETIGADDDDCTNVTDHCVAKGKTIRGGNGESAESGRHDETVKPAGPDKPTEPGRHGETVKPARPDKPTEPEKSVQVANTADHDEKDSNGNTVIYVLIVVLIMVTGGAAYVLILKKKRAGRI